jgi:hypothetical protein
MLKLDLERAHLLQLRLPRYGSTYREQVKNEFWDYMIRVRKNAYWANTNLALKIKRGEAQRLLAAQSGWRDHPEGPTWCFTRHGRTVTQSFDKVIYIGGTHEDWYDPDFCIYNDVVVEHTDGTFDIYTYPKNEFPPTDDHTASLVGNHLYLIGSVGYQDLRRYGDTQVYLFNTFKFTFEEIVTAGVTPADSPGWISRHSAEYDRRDHKIRIAGGRVQTDHATITPNPHTFELDLDSGLWQRL